MKTAIRIIALIEAIFCLVACVASLVAGIVLLVLSAQDLTTMAPPEATAEELQALKAGLLVGGIVSLISIAFLAVGSVFCFVSRKLAGGPTIRSSYITWGVLDIIFVSAPVGILLIVEGAVHGNTRQVE